MERYGVRCTNDDNEFRQRQQDTYAIQTMYPQLFGAGEGSMDNLKTLQEPRGQPPDDKKKAKETVEEGRGGFFGYGGQVRDIINKSKPENPGEAVQKETREKAGETGKKMEPAIIPADHPAFTAAVGATNIEVTLTTDAAVSGTASGSTKPGEGAQPASGGLGGGDTNVSSPVLMNSMMYESSGGNKKDNIGALASIMAPLHEREEEKRAKRDSSVKASSPKKMDLKAYLGPSEALHRIAQETVRLIKIRHEVSENQRKLLELHAIKVKLLARLCAMEGEVFTDKLNKSLRENVGLFDDAVFIRSTHRGSGSSSKD